MSRLERGPAGPLQVDPSNPRYFTDGSGRPVYLAGAYTFRNLQDMGPTSPPPTYDYEASLDFLERHGHNLMRLWKWDLTLQLYRNFDSVPWHTAPHPWLRVGPGAALDGQPKFDLTRFDEQYFDRLRERVSAAGDRGIYVAIMLFEGFMAHSSSPPWRTDGQPFHPDNNVNGIDGNPDGDEYMLEPYTLQIPEITAIQKAYVRKVVDTVNDLDNVLYEVANEAGPYSVAWQHEMVREIKDYQATKPKQHPVGMSMLQGGPFGTGPNEDLFQGPADYVSPGRMPGDPYHRDPPVADGRKVVVLDLDHVWGGAGDGAWIWKSFLRGHNPLVLHNDLLTPKPGDRRVSAYPAIHHTRAYAERLRLDAVLPRPDLVSTGYALADPGSAYLVYAPRGGPFAVHLAAGPYQYEWFNPTTGCVSRRGKIDAAEGNRWFTPPFWGAAVLYLVAGRS